MGFISQSGPELTGGYFGNVDCKNTFKKEQERTNGFL